MSVGVCNTCEDGVVLEQPLEASQVHLRGERQEQRGERDRQPAPESSLPGGDTALGQETRAAGSRRRNSAAITQPITASFSNQPAMSCQAGSVNK